MAGYTDSPFRRVIQDVVPGTVTFTELISVDAIHYNSKKTFDMLRFHEGEHPLIVQLFGNKPEFFREAVQKLHVFGFDGIDINMGCPARKVVKSDNGSALILRPDLAYSIVSECKKTTSLPVSVKTRIGWADDMELINFCKGLYEAGADLITIHGRTVKQVHDGEACWDSMYHVQEQLPIPILGNGGITDRADGITKMKNLAGFLIGRAVIGNPWCLSEETFSAQNKRTTMKRHLQLMVEYYGEKLGLLEFRKHASEYITGKPGSKQLRKEIMEWTDLDTVLAVLDRV